MQGYRPLWQFCLAALTAWLVFPANLQAVPTILLGNYNLQPNTPNQTIQIFATGGDSVSGIVFAIQTGDGGYYGGGTGTLAHPYSAPPSFANSNNVPLAVNLTPTGSSVFTPTNAAQGPPNGPNQWGGADTQDPTTHQVSPTPYVSQLWLVSVSTNSGSVPVGGALSQQLLATITIDTTGFFGGVYPLKLLDTVDGSTQFQTAGGPVTPIAPDGTLTVVPEPSTLACLVLGLPLLLLRKRRALQEH